MNKTLLLILDGFGNNPSKIGNAIKQANTPNIDNFFASNAVAQLETSGMAVGLAKGVMGNSEVGHLNIGAGRIVSQLNTMITQSISEGDFFHNNALNN
ncbi:MAG: 2,3-bisphosphoglycerate-independent phosphoglycerate mutase, partial [Candidatus Cloacimonetes bacterium]|nr:2,3-bisphosphoglycerate-independent phosphoglycerate mutase [Candidatus Cloacimonadota bacterium]